MLDTTDSPATKRSPKGPSKPARSPMAPPAKDRLAPADPRQLPDEVGQAISPTAGELSSEAPIQPNFSPRIRKGLPKIGRQEQTAATSNGPIAHPSKEATSRAPSPGPNGGDASAAGTGPQETGPQETDPEVVRKKGANAIRRGLLPAMMATFIERLPGFGNVYAWRRYLDDLMRDAGDPRDPVEIMLLEQMNVCHLRAIQLQSQAAQAKGNEVFERYSTAAVRLATEVRKIALTLSTYRGRR
jgi:hypothetical protein